MNCFAEFLQPFYMKSIWKGFAVHFMVKLIHKRCTMKWNKGIRTRGSHKSLMTSACTHHSIEVIKHGKILLTSTSWRTTHKSHCGSWFMDFHLILHSAAVRKVMARSSLLYFIMDVYRMNVSIRCSSGLIKEFDWKLSNSELNRMHSSYRHDKWKFIKSFDGKAPFEHLISIYKTAMASKATRMNSRANRRN